MPTIFEIHTLDELIESIDIQFEARSTYSHDYIPTLNYFLDEAALYFTQLNFMQDQNRFDTALTMFIEGLDPHISSMYLRSDGTDSSKRKDIETKYNDLLINIINNTNSMSVYDCIVASEMLINLDNFLIQIKDLDKIRNIQDSCYADESYFDFTNAIIESKVPHIDLNYKINYFADLFKNVYSLSVNEQVRWFDDHFCLIADIFIQFISNNSNAIVRSDSDFKYYICANEEYVGSISTCRVVCAHFKSLLYESRLTSLKSIAESLNLEGSPAYWKSADLKIHDYSVSSDISFLE